MGSQKDSTDDNWLSEAITNEYINCMSSGFSLAFALWLQAVIKLMSSLFLTENKTLKITVDEMETQEFIIFAIESRTAEDNNSIGMTARFVVRETIDCGTIVRDDDIVDDK